VKKIFCAVAFMGLASSVFATEPAEITPELLASQSWMSSAPVDESCEIPPLINFKKDGSLSGEPGCNDLMGNYVIGKDGAFEFQHMGLTRKMCARKYMEMEQEFIDMLNKTRYAKVIDGKIRFYDAEKKELGGIEKEKSGACS